MRTIEIARRMAQLNQKEDAQKAYLLALHEAENQNPEEELEAASYIFFSEGDYQIAFTTFVSLYNRGFFQDELMDLMTQAFYLPNVEKQRKRYKQNCAELKRYTYFFHDTFCDFEDLPILFFPFDDHGFVPFYKEENRFGEYINLNYPVIDRYFFKDLENPILAADVYSQYQLEYLNDNVRKSEWIGRENHIYLHYTSWNVFCAYLQCLNLKKILSDKKFVFLFEEEISRYPIDFKKEFHIDYSQYPVRPIGIREVNRLIWHTQLATHNGGDFFNEIFYGHPNLIIMDSVIFSKLQEKLALIMDVLKKKGHFENPELRKLETLHHPTEKDCLIAYFLMVDREHQSGLQDNSRIAPALFFQPHFYNIMYQIDYWEKTGVSRLYSQEYESIRTSPIFKQFAYVKTFTPMRRITSSYAATVRFMETKAKAKDENEEPTNFPDEISVRCLNRSFMIDWQDRLFQDSILVRFEDGKLNPKATFTALAEFLDLPYTDSMTYCSGISGVNPESMEGNVRGFDPATVYRTYDEYVDDADRAFLEYFMRDAYEAYGYDFHYYHGESVDQKWVENKIASFQHLNDNIRFCYKKTFRSALAKTDMDFHQAMIEVNGMGESIDSDTLDSDSVHWSSMTFEEQEEVLDQLANQMIAHCEKNRRRIAQILLQGLYFVNKNGQPLQLMKPLKLDPALLEQPLYH